MVRLTKKHRDGQRQTGRQRQGQRHKAERQRKTYNTDTVDREAQRGRETDRQRQTDGDKQTDGQTDKERQTEEQTKRDVQNASMFFDILSDKITYSNLIKYNYSKQKRISYPTNPEICLPVGLSKIKFKKLILSMQIKQC